MPSEPLFQAVPGKLLDDGVMPSAEPTVGLWSSANNAWFRELHIEHMPGSQKICSSIGRPARALAQVYAGGKQRFYYEDLGIINLFNAGDPGPTVIDALSPAGDYHLCPYGEWLLATDNVNNLKLWKGTGGFANTAAGEFSRCKIIKKLAQHVIAYASDVYPTGLHWCSASDPETWTPAATNSARNLPIRDLDSDIIAVEALGSGHAIYSRSTLLLLQYLGSTSGWFGTPSQSLTGIGAVSKHSVIPLGKFNWGLNRGGIFLTDGTGFMYVDRPSVDRWVQDYIDWERADEIVGYYDEKLVLLKWTVPLLAGGSTVLCLDPRAKSALNRVWPGYQDSGQRAFTYADTTFSAAVPRNVFDYPIIARNDGIYLDSVRNTLAGNFTLTGQLIDGGKPLNVKSWDFGYFEGTFTGAEIRFGFTDTPTLASIGWGSWETLEHFHPFGPRESIYMALDFRSSAALRLAGITIMGEVGAPVP